MSRPTTGARRAAYRLGLSAETRAAWMLRLKGYRVLARRVKLPGGELDIVARRGGTLVFVEVKARATLEAALDAVGPASQRRILTAADRYVADRPAYAALERRFDLVAVLPGRWPVHRPAIYRVDTIGG